jgi:predicted Zn finger-like uncharacterized protein
MPTIVACPSCGGTLRVADDLLGQAVRCPACNGTFDTARPARAPEPLGSDADRPEPAPRGLKGAVELELPPGDEPPPRRPDPPPRDDGSPPTLDDMRYGRSRCPECGRRVGHDADRCPYCDEPIADDRRRGRRIDRSRMRRDHEPDRGATVLTLGICSLVFTAVFFPAGLVLGLMAWVMGHGDLKKIKSGQMDPEGEGLTWNGWLCGMLGTGLSTLMLLGCFLLLGWMVHENYNAPTPPTTRKMRRVPPGGPPGGPPGPPRRPGQPVPKPGP